MQKAVQKLLCFQEILKTLPVKESYTPEEICQVIAKYIERYDTEIEQIEDKGARYKARPPSARHEVITALVSIEKKEFVTAGFGAKRRIRKDISLLSYKNIHHLTEAPDLTDGGVVKRLR